MTVNQYYDTFFRGNINSEVILIAGDLGHNINQVASVFKMLENDYKHVLFCVGNHEFWHNTGREKYKNWAHKLDTLKNTICSDKVKFMDGNIFDYKGVAIGGSCMWYDFSSAVTRGVQKSKFNIMCNSYFPDPLKMGFNTQMDCELWFKKEYDKAKNIIEDCDVYFSHVGPKEPNILPKEYDNFATGFFYFDGQKLLNTKRIKNWVFGHTHDIIFEQYVKDNGSEVSLLCNPVGYYGENRFKNVVKSFKV